MNVASLREIAEKATPGEWRAYFTVNGDPFVVYGDSALPLTHQIAKVSVSPADYGRADAIHIATFDPPRVLALLDMIEEAPALLRRWMNGLVPVGDYDLRDDTRAWLDRVGEL